MTNTPQTLGEALNRLTITPPAPWHIALRRLAILLVSLIAAIFAYKVFQHKAAPLIALAVTPLLSMLFPLRHSQRRHWLLKLDRHGLLQHLQLDAKTAVFDGSNIYHLGLKQNVGPLPLRALADRLREEGYRIVCFFDANIYFTLRDNGNIPPRSGRFHPNMLCDAFGLSALEIYVVPKGVQADKFIVETLSHLPISFAVTNDRFRDYEAQYSLLRESNDWRKGVTLKGGTIQLYQHRFNPPLELSAQKRKTPRPAGRRV
ncbi:hypothetical protein [Neptunicoccus cionae]|uniref:RNase NYN domain-containing protein n=1 Tax=Neptunicoccus cionae TaxID=2035344 RepID=A0A916R213_9RHOB|nr:hypothetical protein [Amylibacter cionae]GGA31604.1 hypothetical protein GCM10011498_36080 [Amylibacter cionae]